MKAMRTHGIYAILMLIALSFVTIGCNGKTTVSGDGDYLMQVERNKFCNFSFEYNKSYDRAGPHYVLDFKPPFMYITLLAPREFTEVVVPSGKDAVTTATAEYVPGSIEITVVKAMESVNTSNSAQEKIEAVLEDWSKWKGYALIARYPLEVAGIEGEFVEYSIGLEHKCAVYFDHNGLIWSVELNSKDSSNYSSAKADFDHVLQTFKILD